MTRPDRALVCSWAYSWGFTAPCYNAGLLIPIWGMWKYFHGRVRRTLVLASVATAAMILGSTLLLNWARHWMHPAHQW